MQGKKDYQDKLFTLSDRDPFNCLQPKEIPEIRTEKAKNGSKSSRSYFALQFIQNRRQIEVVCGTYFLRNSILN